MREDVDRVRLEAFLTQLGRSFRHPARLYLSGGESLVWRGVRGTTRDIDVTYEVDSSRHGEWVATLRRLKESCRVNVEEAGPADFVPLPSGAAARAQFVGRFGSVDVFLFDAYSIALSKLVRWHARDRADVRALIDLDVLEPERLRAVVEEVLPAFAARAVRNDPDRLRRNLESALSSPPSSD